MLNTITLPSTVLTISNKQRPFKCNFKQVDNSERFKDNTWNTKLELVGNGMDGRIVYAVYTEDGKLTSAITVN